MPSCEDCYFRQELLCALQRDSVCPTFRATVQQPQAAVEAAAAPQVMSVTQVAAPAQVAAPLRVAAVAATRSAAAAPEPAQVGALAQLDLGSEPFGTESSETVFSLREACAAAPAIDAPTVVPAREAVTVPRIDPSAVRAAAATRRVGEQCVVEFDGEASEQDGSRETVLVSVAAFGSDGGRVARVTRRIAERYPNALQLC
jgi:hypothetical protein